MKNIVSSQLFSNGAGPIAKVIKGFLDTISGGNSHITMTTLQDQLRKHKDYPSLLSIVDILEKWKYKSATLRIESHHIFEIPVPFITHINENQKGEFIQVTDLSIDTITWSNDKKKQKEPLNTFLLKWSNVVLVSEASSNRGEPNYWRKRTSEIMASLAAPLQIILLAALIAAPFILTDRPINIVASFITILSIFGLILSSSLISMTYESKNSIFKHLCRVSESVNCTSILESPGASFFGLISWAEVGLLYFLSTTSALVIGHTANISEQIIQLLTWVAIPSILYPFYSVYYQWRIAKVWCTLCLGVQFILVANVLILIWSFNPKAQITSDCLYVLLWSILLAVLFWTSFKPYLLSKVKAKATENKLNRFRFRSDFFAEALSRQPLSMPVPSELMPFRFGNDKAENVLTVVTSPFCKYCKQAHSTLEELLLENKNVRAELVISTSKEIEHKTNKVAAQWLSLSERNGDITNYIKSWYQLDNPNQEKYLNKYPTVIEERHLLAAARHGQWVRDSNIPGTPAFLLNGRLIPDPYTIEDLGILLS